MKKFQKILLFLVLAVFLWAGSAGATLLGVENYIPSYPDIKFDDQGKMRYTPATGLFEIYNSVDEQITMADGSIYGMSNTYDYSIVTGFGLAINVNNSGDLIGGVTNHTYSWDISNNNGFYTGNYTSDFDMVEVLLRGEITIDGHTYDATTSPVVLLQAEVSAFGSDNNDTVDFWFSDVSGALVDDGIWPMNQLSGAFAKSPAGAIDWTNGFVIENKGGDKIPAPVPEPATLLLLGSGLIGLAGIGRRKIKKARSS